MTEFPDPEKQPKTRNSYKHWHATYPFVDFKLSSLINALLVAALVGVGIFQGVIYYRQAKIMSSQVNISQGQLAEMRAEHRPWIYASIALNGPITWTADNDAQIRFAIAMKNTGSSSAINIVTRFKIETLRVDNKNSIFNRMAVQTMLCKQAEEESAHDKFAGQTLFPTEIKSGEISANSDHTELPKAWPNSHDVSFRLVGCVDYTFSQSTQIHGQTGFGYEISRYADQRSHRAGFVPGEVTQAKDIALDSDFFHGMYLK